VNALDRAIVAIAPETGLRRLRAKRAAAALMNYDIANGGRRTKSTRYRSTDADAASNRRLYASFAARDLVRNNPVATRARDVLVSNIIGDGIIPSLAASRGGTRARFLELVKVHCDTTAIDADGRCNLYGLQRVIMAAVVTDGEVLVRVRRRRPSDGLALPFQLQVLEADYLDESADILNPNGAMIRDGIEYDAIGRRVAYHLYDHHPGSDHRLNGRQSRRVPASEIIHVQRVDRPGQQRGVSWFAPVAVQMQDLGDYLDAQVVRQKIAACFAAFHISADAEPNDAVVPSKLSPGFVGKLGAGDDVKFSSPPAVDGLDTFVKTAMQAIASGLGITYEALSGDLSQVNFSSGRMGRMEMDRNISAWQWLMLRPQLLDPIAALILEAWQIMEPTRALRGAAVDWTPPARVIIDPAKEIPAMRDAIRAGLRSWQSTVRALGYDPETVANEMAEDAARFDAIGVVPESDPRSGTTPAAAEPADPARP
jgi:lambda family phage portal protein